MTLSARIGRAAALAHGDGASPVHVALAPADWDSLGIPRVTAKPAYRAPRSVLWARRGDKMIPYELED